MGEAKRYERIQLLAELKKLDVRLESLLKQKFRVRWLAAGDMNSRFFHSITNWRKKNNNFAGMIVQNEWCERFFVF